ncbi:MAG: peptide chain release factor N(5)-glutamine methyltransferase [Bacillota bacterium]|nr:peptide chain release factor N(5)-glutamine methyltransferase [Bacillota bacterium]
MEQFWRIKDLLEWTTRYFQEKGVEESRLEADILLAHVLQKDRVYLYANYDRPVNAAERAAFRQIIQRRAKKEPVAYILGHKEFMSLDFVVSPAVLIPRPDTERMVEVAVDIARNESVRRICDVGTGSGVIAISLAKELGQNICVYAVDSSEEALDIARQNAERHGVSAEFIHSDLLENLSRSDKMDIIAANLPYISHAIWTQLDPEVRDYEPKHALVADCDGLELYRKLIPQAHECLRPGGTLLMEIDPRQAEAARAMITGFEDVKIIQDYAGRDRIVSGRRKMDA